MKRYILIAVITVIAVGLFGQITFDPQPADEASNIQGSVFKWNGATNQFEKQYYAPLTVTLYYNDGTLFQQEYITSGPNGEYSFNFEDQYENCNYCNEVSVQYLDATYNSNYDGIERIDIYYVPQADDGDTPSND